MTDVKEDVDLLSALDFTPQCGCVAHGNKGHEAHVFHDDGPATCLVEITCPCGTVIDELGCASYGQAIWAVDETVTHNACGTKFVVNQHLRVTPL